MSHFKRITTIIYCVLLSSFIVASASALEKGKLLGTAEVVLPSWFKESFLDFREDSVEAAEQGKHMLVFVDLKGCPYCAKMLQDNFKISEKDGGNSEFIQKNFDSIQLDLKGGREVAFNETTTVSESALAAALKVRFTPTLLFMNEKNKVVARVNGYRSAREFRQVLNFVHEKAYQKTDFSSYRKEHLTDTVYTLKDHENFVAMTDFQDALLDDKPLVIMFEDKTCDECDRFHKEVLALPETKALMKGVNFVRLDALSDQEIVDTQGNKTTAAKWLKEKNISYRPALLFFAEGKEIEQLTGLIKSFHFQQLLSFFVEKKYNQYPNFIAYGDEYSARILESGKDIDIWK